MAGESHGDVVIVKAGLLAAVISNLPDGDGGASVRAAHYIRQEPPVPAA